MNFIKCKSCHASLIVKLCLLGDDDNGIFDTHPENFNLCLYLKIRKTKSLQKGHKGLSGEKDNLTLKNVLDRGGVDWGGVTVGAEGGPEGQLLPQDLGQPS